MDATHAHLVLTHFPIIGTLIGAIILAYGLYAKEDKIIKLVLVTFIVMALMTIPVYRSGEGAEDTIEQLDANSETFVEAHEELAEMAIWLMGLLGCYALFNLYMVTNKSKLSKTITVATLLLSVATFSMFAQVGNLGGQIRHTEIRSDNINSQIENQDKMIEQHPENDQEQNDD